MCLIFEVGMLIGGIILLVTGKFTMSRNRVVRGTPARLIGVLLILPLPLAFCVGFVVGVGMVARHGEVDAHQLQNLAPIEGGITLLCLLAALGIGLATAKAPPKKRRYADEDVFEDEYDDAYDEQTPRPRRRRRDGDEEPPLPPRSRRRDEEEEDDLTPPPRRRRRDDDEDEEPPRRPDGRYRE